MSSIASSDFDISVSGHGPTITRNLVFKSGESITFKIQLPKVQTDTIIDLHQKSAARVIQLMQEFATPPAK